MWINQGDIILISLRDFQDDKADVIQKYTSDEARNLKQYGELPETAKINETDTFGEEEGGEVEFEEASDDDLDDRECAHALRGSLIITLTTLASHFFFACLAPFLFRPV